MSIRPISLRTRGGIGCWTPYVASARESRRQGFAVLLLCLEYLAMPTMARLVAVGIACPIDLWALL